MRLSLLSGLCVCFLLGVAISTSMEGVASHTREHKLLAILPDEGMTVSNDSQIVMVFGVGLTSGSEIATPLESFSLEIGFSIELDVSDLLRSLANKGEVRKVSHCQGSAVSVAISVGFGAVFEFTLDPAIVFGRTNRSRTIEEPFQIKIRGPTNVIWGRIVDSESRSLTDITATLKQGGVVVTSVLSNTTGIYVLRGVSPGGYTVCASAPGYNESCRGGILIGGGTLRIDHVMTRSPVERVVDREVIPPWVYATIAALLVGVAIAFLLGRRRGRGPQPVEVL